VPLIDNEHLAGHPLIALITDSAAIQKALANLFDFYLFCTWPVCSGLHLAFDLDAKRVGRFLIQAMLTLPVSVDVSIVHDPSRFVFTPYVSPTTFVH
jgi:hypothetical protein